MLINPDQRMFQSKDWNAEWSVNQEERPARFAVECSLSITPPLLLKNKSPREKQKSNGMKSNKCHGKR